MTTMRCKSRDSVGERLPGARSTIKPQGSALLRERRAGAGAGAGEGRERGGGSCRDGGCGPEGRTLDSILMTAESLKQLLRTGLI